MEALRQAVDRINREKVAYHTQLLPGGITIQGEYNHERLLPHYGLPADMAGLRVLDLGTADGYFAFHFEQAGAAEVVAVDHVRRECFSLVHEALQSKVRFIESDLYTLDPHELGAFDLVFCSSVLLHLTDPLGAVKVMRGLCCGTAIIASGIYPNWGIGRLFNVLLRRRPVAHFVALGQGTTDATYWLPNEACLRRMALSAGFNTAEITGHFHLISEPDRANCDTPHAVLVAKV